MCDTSMMPFRVAMPKSVMKPDDRRDRQHAAGQVHADHAADQRQRQVHHDEQPVARRAERRRQDEEDRDDDAERQPQQLTATRRPRSRTARRTRRGSPAAARPICATRAWMSFTTLRRSRPATLHCTTMRRWAFSRITKFGPAVLRQRRDRRQRNLAAVRRLDPRRARSALEVRESSPRSYRTTSGNAICPSSTWPTCCPTRAVCSASVDRAGHQAVARRRGRDRRARAGRNVGLRLRGQIHDAGHAAPSRPAPAGPAPAAAADRRRRSSRRCSRACPTACGRCGARSAARP